MHPSSLWGGYSIGSFGDAGRELIDFLYECGFKVWQTLPFCMTDEYNSPYSSPAAFSFNPYFIDLPELYKKGYITDSELSSARENGAYLCEFSRLKNERLPLLLKAAERAVREEDMRASVTDFLSENPQIKNAARFLILRQRHGGTARQSRSEEKSYEHELLLWGFLHYEFYRQWQSLKKYANEKGIEIIGDVPIYVSLESADVFSSPDNFLLDSSGFPIETAGVPPDYFSPEGQMWGNPIYNYEKMAENGFSWWRERIKHAFKLFDGVRIDHFRGLDSYWSIPRGSKSAANGSWKRGPGAELVKILSEEAGKRLLIAEDLGNIDESVTRLLDDFSLPGMRVFEFAFLGDSDSSHLPHNYINNIVAYSGTHDNNTLLGYLYECERSTRRRIFDYCSYTGEDIDVGCRQVIRTLFASSAGIVILPIQDILGFGADTRMNIPGRSEGNWAYRVTREQLMAVDRKYYRSLAELYGRI